jgi:hypothetical protein
MDFVLEHSKSERTEAMKADFDRQAQLEQEVRFVIFSVILRDASCLGNLNEAQYQMIMPVSMDRNAVFYESFIFINTWVQYTTSAMSALVVMKKWSSWQRKLKFWVLKYVSDQSNLLLSFCLSILFLSFCHVCFVSW